MRGARSGFSVVELIVAVGIAAMVFTGVIFLFRNSRESSASAQEKASVLHQGRMLIEQIKRDLRTLHFDPAATGDPWTMRPDQLTFKRQRGGASGTALTEEIEYALEATDLVAVRRVDGQVRRFGGGAVKIRELVFKQVRHRDGGREAIGVAITVRLSDADDEPRSRLSLQTVVYPPTLDRPLKQSWVE